MGKAALSCMATGRQSEAALWAPSSCNQAFSHEARQVRCSVRHTAWPGAWAHTGCSEQCYSPGQGSTWEPAFSKQQQIWRTSPLLAPWLGFMAASLPWAGAMSLVPDSGKRKVVLQLFLLRN